MRQRVLFSAWPQFDERETAFWHALRDALHARDLTLVLASSARTPAYLDVEHVAVTTTIDAFWPMTEGGVAGVPVDLLGLDADLLLARESAWSGPPIIPALERSRRHAIDAVVAERLHWLQTLSPVATVIWNGQHVGELILAAASRQGGAPVLYVERAPIANALFADEAGLSSASHVASASMWPAPETQWSTLASSIDREMRETRATWWEQPAARDAALTGLRAALDIPADARVVLFAGQVDEDTQGFLFSPLHRTNLDAFRWLLAKLAAFPDVYVLGKQHPRSGTPAARYEECLAASTIRGRWRSDVSIDDALTVADRVAAVNSTVLYEAQSRRKPVLALGGWLLGHQGTAYESTTDPYAVERWMNGSDHPAHQRRWIEGLGHLLKHSLYAFDATGPRAGMRSAADLAGRIAALAAPTPWRPSERITRGLIRAMGTRVANWSPADAAWPDRRDAMAARLSEWHRAQSLRYMLMPAVRAHRQGRRVLIWGAGSAARTVATMLSDAGARVHGLVGDHGEPTALPSSMIWRVPVADFVVVLGTSATDPDHVRQQLEMIGLDPAVDSTTVDCEMLASMTPSGTAESDAA